MFKFLKRLFRHQSLAPYKSFPHGFFRDASVKDIQFIAQNIVDGAVDGHLHSLRELRLSYSHPTLLLYFGGGKHTQPMRINL